MHLVCKLSSLLWLDHTKSSLCLSYPGAVTIDEERFGVLHDHHVERHLGSKANKTSLLRTLFSCESNISPSDLLLSVNQHLLELFKQSTTEKRKNPNAPKLHNPHGPKTNPDVVRR